MQDIKVFDNKDFGKIRALNINNEPWFIGKDIAEKLGYNEPHKAINRHIEEDDRMKHPIVDNLGRIQETYIINESGLYSLILSSKLPQAKKFKRWVTSEVLPSIRKTGTYGENSDILLNILKMQNIILEKMSEDKKEIHKLDTHFKELDENQMTYQKTKVSMLPEHLKQDVKYMLSSKNRNFSYISRYLLTEGYHISNVAISNYYKNYYNGGIR